MDCVGPRIPRFWERTKEPQDWCERRWSQSVWRPEQHTQYLARVCMHIQPSPLEVHEEKVHNNVYASSRDKTTRYGPQSILQLSKEELETLWKDGVNSWDAAAKEYFPMKAAVITTMH